MIVTHEPLHPYQSDAWRLQRMPYVTASNAAVMFSRHPYTTPGDYWTEKATRDIVGIDITPAMKRGHVLEEPVAKWWAEEENMAIHQSTLFHICGPLAATTDYLTDDGRPVEIKTTSQRTETPAQYWIDQLQAQMACLDAVSGWVVWFDGDTLHSEEIERDDEFIADLYVRAEQFLAAIETGLRPDWIDLGADNVRTLHPNPKGVVDINDDDLLAALYAYQDLKNDGKADDLELKELKDRIANAFGDHEIMTYEGAQVATWKKRKGNTYLDLDALVAAHPDVNLKSFEKRRASTRVMSIKVDL